MWVLDGGGRGHALGWKLSQSERIGNIVFSPGNGGTESLGKNCVVNYQSVNELGAFCEDHEVDLAVIGMDRPLADGVVDKLQHIGVPAFGPTQLQARIESDRSYTKNIMTYTGIPTAEYMVFDEYATALEYCDSKKLPFLVKANGLADGKGAMICRDRADVDQVLRDMMVLKRFASSGEEVVIEDYLEGQEISLHDICSNGLHKSFISAQDHKQLLDGDKGPMTGGMGTIAPVPWFGTQNLNDAENIAVQPLLDTVDFEGMLFTGLMITPDGPKVLEYNARFGDPETQVYMRLMKSDLLEHIAATINGHLYTERLEWEDKYAVCVVAAAEGYPDSDPGSSTTDAEITGHENVEDSVVVFHAGSALEGGRHYVNGGRVLGITAVGGDIDDARDRAYEQLERIRFGGKLPQFRRDIGKRPPPIHK